MNANAQVNLGDIIVQPATPRVNDTVRIVTAPSSSTCNSFNIDTSALTMVMSNNRITVTIPRAGRRLRNSAATQYSPRLAGTVSSWGL